MKFVWKVLIHCFFLVVWVGYIIWQIVEFYEARDSKNTIWKTELKEFKSQTDFLFPKTILICATSPNYQVIPTICNPPKENY